MSYHNTNEPTDTGLNREKKPNRFLMFLLKGILPLIIIAGGTAGGWYIYKTRPKAKKIKPEQVKALVKVMLLKKSSEQITLHEKGTVIPVHKINLQARVSGEVIRVNPEFTVGGILKKGEEILKIDPSDYKLAVQRAQQQLINAQANLALEMGRQAVARHEWDLLSKNNYIQDSGQTNSPGNTSVSRDHPDKELALRKPQLRQMLSAVKMAQATLDQTKLNLQRTTIYAPFNAIVYTKNIDAGSQVMPQQMLGVLVNTDEYWVQVSLPVDELKWIKIPKKNSQTGSTACIIYNKDSQSQCERYGNVVRLLGDIEKNGRMARILISVHNPLKTDKAATGGTPLLVNDYVSVDIQGQNLQNVFKIPRSALHEGNKIWIADEIKAKKMKTTGEKTDTTAKNAENKKATGNKDEKPERRDGVLDIRTVRIIWSDLQNAIIDKGVSEGEKLIITDLSAPVKGMAIQLEQDIKHTPSM